MPQGIGDIFLEFLDVHFRQVHVFLSVVCLQAFDLLPVTAVVEQPAATSNEG